MFRKVTMCALAGAAMTMAAPALGQGPHGGGGGHAFGRVGAAGIGNLGRGDAGMNSIGIQTREAARVNSQGPAHASATGIAHANAHSVLKRGTVGTTTPLTGITNGMALNRNGTNVGTVTRVNTNGRGVITRVHVRGTNGRNYSLAPSSLSLTDGTLSTSTALRGF